MLRQNKFVIRQSLLHSYLMVYETEDGFDRFVNALNKIDEPPNRKMLDGIKFENLVNTALDGEEIPETHEWHKPVTELKELLWGSRKQVNICKDIEVNGVKFLLNGTLDFLRKGQIFDTKFSKHYYLNKYLNSPQHSAYFYLVPNAYKFTYLSCDGHYIYKESYRREDTKPIEFYIKDFMAFLERNDLVDVYCRNYKS